MTDTAANPVAASPNPASSDITTSLPAEGSKKLGNLRMVWQHASVYPRQICYALISLVVAASATLAIPAGIRLVIDRGFASGGDTDDIARWFEYLLLIAAIMAVATAFRFYFVSWLGERTVADIRIAVNRNLLRQSPAFFEENRPAEIASRLTSDTTIIEQVVGTTVSVALRNIVLGIGGTIYLFSLAPKLAVGLLITIPLIILPIVLIGRKLQSASRASQDRVADVGAMVAETLGAMRIVQAFGQESREGERFGRSVDKTFTAAKTRIMLRAMMTAIVMALIFGAITLILWRGAIDVAEGRMTGGTIFSFIIAGFIVAGAFGALTEVYGDLVRGAGASGRLNELLAVVPDIAPPAKPVALPQPPRGQVSFEAVRFRYPTRPEIAALDNFTLKVNPGETVAVVGPSGAGKSTLFQLAQRF
jgi:ATP-binding cassette, subfamily B, bacterial